MRVIHVLHVPTVVPGTHCAENWVDARFRLADVKRGGLSLDTQQRLTKIFDFFRLSSVETTSGYFIFLQF